MDYQDFIRRKHTTSKSYGFDVPEDSLNAKAFDWQRRIVCWALKRGRAALFLDTGLGKTLCQLMWAEEIVKRTGGSVLLHCPVGVRLQTQREALKFGIGVPVLICNSQEDVQPGVIAIANYEKLHKFVAEEFQGVVLDESSILKGIDSKTKEYLCAVWGNCAYRLACTATPSPNDTQELGNHAEFLGVCSNSEMKSKYFVNDSGNTQKWRLKGHAVDAFWDWVCDWAACVTLPSDIGGDDTGYILPPIDENTHVVHVPAEVPDGMLFDTTGISATNIHQEKRHTSPYRAAKTSELVNGNSDQWVVWCDTDYETEDVMKVIPDAIEVKGSMPESVKEANLQAFIDGTARVLVTKSVIAGMGQNWQHCHRMVFNSINYSFEQRYQAIRRCYRFGQQNTVSVHYVTTDTEHAITHKIDTKIDRHIEMQEQMRAAAQRSSLVRSADRGRTTYSPSKRMEIPQWLTRS